MTHENRSLRVASQNGKIARSVLVLEGQLSPNLIQLKLMLGVNVLDGVNPQSAADTIAASVALPSA